jgi:hypothetical protein
MGYIRVRFVANDTFVSKAIRKITGSLFSHVEFGTPEGTWIGALAGSGIQERPANYCRPSLAYVYEIPCTDAQQQALLAWARARVGTKYNYADIAGLLFQARRLTSPTRMICSQDVTEGLLIILGAWRVLNVQEQWDYRITPEILHLSPIFAGHLVSRKG